MQAMQAIQMQAMQATSDCSYTFAWQSQGRTSFVQYFILVTIINLTFSSFLSKMHIEETITIEVEQLTIKFIAHSSLDTL